MGHGYRGADRLESVMRWSLLQAGLISAFLSHPGLLAQHAGPGAALAAPHGSVASHVSSGGAASSRSFAPATPNRSGHWPSWNGENGTKDGNRRGYSRDRYPYVYSGLLSYGYGFPVGYGFGDGSEQADAGAARQQGSVDAYGPLPPDAQLGENAPPLYRVPYRASSEAPPAAPARMQPATTLIFNDGRAQKQIHNYALIGTTLWVLDDDTRREIPLASLDIPATVKANRDAGVDFALPGNR